jgi:hypothetical protein
VAPCAGSGRIPGVPFQLPGFSHPKLPYGEKHETKFNETKK